MCVCVCVCVCVGGGGGGGGRGGARQYKGVKKGITVNGDSIRLLVVISFTQVLARQPEGTSTGRSSLRALTIT